LPPSLCRHSRTVDADLILPILSPFIFHENSSDAPPRIELFGTGIVNGLVVMKLV